MNELKGEFCIKELVQLKYRDDKWAQPEQGSYYPLIGYPLPDIGEIPDPTQEYLIQRIHSILPRAAVLETEYPYLVRRVSGFNHDKDSKGDIISKDPRWRYAVEGSKIVIPSLVDAPAAHIIQVRLASLDRSLSSNFVKDLNTDHIVPSCHH